MNKKKLPKAIQTTGAEARATGPVPAAAWQQSSARPAPPHDGDDKATTARPAAAPARRHKAAATEAPQPVTPGSAEAQDRRARAMKVIERFSVWAGAAGLIPLPFVDLAAVGGLQFEMLRRISKIYGVPFSENRGKAVIASFAGSMIPASSGIGAASLLKGLPLVGTAISVVAMPTLSAGATYAIGMAFIQHFNSGGTLLDFNPPDYHEFLKAVPNPTAAKSAPASHAD